MLRKGCNALDDSGNRLTVVVGWHYHTDLTFLHHLLYIRHHPFSLDALGFATLLVEEHYRELGLHLFTSHDDTFRLAPLVSRLY